MRAKISCCIFTLALTGCFKTGVETATSVQNLPSCEGTCAAGFACDLKSNQCVFVGFSGQDSKRFAGSRQFWAGYQTRRAQGHRQKGQRHQSVRRRAVQRHLQKWRQMRPDEPQMLRAMQAYQQLGIGCAKITKLSIAPANQGCDLNDDGKPDNAIGKALASFKQFDEAFSKGIADGSWVWLLEAAAPGYASDGSQFHINLFSGVADPKIPFCDYASQTGNCGYLVDAADYDGNSSADPCPAMQVTKNAMINAA